MTPSETASHRTRRSGPLFVVAFVVTVLTGCVAIWDVSGILGGESIRPVIIVPGMQASRLVSQQTGGVGWGVYLANLERRKDHV